MLEPRQEKILLAVIREYIETAEPVGSGVLVSKYNLNCSSATIRNEMVRLEEMGYLYQPHTSAGRVPCDQGYRYYVDRLLERRITPPHDAEELAHRMGEAQLELDALIDHTSRLLSQATHYTSLVLGPRLGRSLFKYLQLMNVGPHHLLLVMMTHTGGVVHRVVEISGSVDADHLARITNLLNDRLRGLSVDAINNEFLRTLPVDSEILDRVAEATHDLSMQSRERVVYEGAANLLGQPEFRDVEKARALLEVLEQEKVVAEILDKSLAEEAVGVIIGGENRISQMQGCTMVTAAYKVDGVLLGTIGVLGPTRLPYDRVISIVQYVADSFSHRLGRATGS
ncbi:MAG: heat-inducible transcription repressor HrcA [Armatimonadetes bacterium]|nr:heat-inducible transcription repressor HrcA [Armatimonadota bacterium]